ncbi:MAG: hypothetical protein ACLP8S_04755 [Solirubrobacteraceae bacterium]
MGTLRDFNKRSGYEIAIEDDADTARREWSAWAKAFAVEADFPRCFDAKASVCADLHRRLVGLVSDRPHTAGMALAAFPGDPGQ